MNYTTSAALLCLFSATLACAADAASPERIRAAAEKAVAAVQLSQKIWYRKETCFSCHQQLLPALAFRAAREHGIQFDETAARADAVAAFRYLANIPRAVEYTNIIDPAISDSYTLFAADAAGVRPSLVTAVYARLLAARQESDGHWDTYDIRPPQSYSPFTATAVTMRAIQLYAHPSQRADTSARVQRASTWLMSNRPRTTEERVYQLRGAAWSGVNAAALTKMADALKATQQLDGGWNSLDGLASDAYSTSEALIALHEAGVPGSDPSRQRGLAYLLKTQAADGTWHVVSRLHPPAPVSPPYIETGHPYGHDQFISAMAESLAVIAMADSLGPAKAQSLELKQAQPAAGELWEETLLFGSTADVKKLLDTGFNPNSTTHEGGLTALMLAMPDLDKAKLLLARGAHAEARAADRYSALLVAAQYPGSGPVMNLLLDRGAQVRPPQGQGTALFNATPTFLAAFAGNGQIIPRLRSAGDRVDDKMNMIGIFPSTAMLAIAPTNRVDAMRALLDAGAKVDDTDLDGMTALAWAAIGNRIDMARLLIQRGADVNHLDHHGMTPLLYAASIDFGDSRMIDLLIQAGAKTNARTPQGATALELARKYKHSHLTASLTPAHS